MRARGFPGGLVLPGHKEASTRLPVERAPLSERLILPLQQHIGAPAKPVVRVGERVLKGQCVAKADGYVSAPLHAPTSGKVAAIAEHPVPHPSGLPFTSIVIEPDGEEAWVDLEPLEDYTACEASVLRNRIREAGVVGMGGAGFPSAVKLNPGKPIHTLILNGAECEPYLTCDDMLMRTRPRAIASGARVIMHLLGARRCLIGIEDNKPEAIAAMKGEAGEGVEVVAVPTRYPAGGEKQLIYTLTGMEVPSGGLPADIGIVCHNVASAAAIFEAVVEGKPLISRYVTVTGGAVKEPRNLEVSLGTPASDLLDACQGERALVERLIMGGPMMGIALHTDEVPVTKTFNGLLAATAREVAPVVDPLPCIRCGKCAEVCPVRLLPQQLYWYARAKDFERVQDYDIFDCIECGCCAYVCPSRLPLVQYYRYAKGEIWDLERERERAERARRRHEFRQFRLEREKAERAARLAKKRGGDKKAAVQEALQRVKEKRAREKDAL